MSQKKLSDILVDTSEKVIIVLGDKYLRNYFKTGELKQSFAILTNRRVYMRGQCYEKKGLFGIRKASVDRTVDIQDVTGTNYQLKDLTWIKILRWILLVVGLVDIGIFLYFAPTYYPDETTIKDVIFISIVGIIPFLCAIPWFIRTKYEFLDISFAGGEITYDCNIATTTEVKEFQKQLRLAKDEKVLKQETTSMSNQINLNTSDRVLRLKELKELLDSGVITESEFNNLKSDIMEN